MKKFFTTLLASVVLLAAVSGLAIFAYLYFTTNGELATLKDDYATSQKTITSLQGQTFSFQDPSLGIVYTVPAGWDVSVDSDMTPAIQDQAQNFFGAGITKYDMSIKKGDAEIVINKIMGPTGTVPYGIPAADYDIEELAKDVVRFRKKGETVWQYGANTECSDLLTGQINGATVCVADFFPADVQNYATLVRVEGKSLSSALLTEIDQIVVTMAK